MRKLKTNPTIGKYAIVFILAAIFTSFTLQAQDLLWKANFTGTGNNAPNRSAIDSHDNIYILVSFNGSCSVPSPNLLTNGNDDIAISKYDSNGNHIWTQQIGGISGDFATGIIVSPDDEYIYITGYFQESVFGVTSTGGMDGFLAKYKSNGEKVWFKDVLSASINSTQRPCGLAIDKNNNLVIGGWFLTEAIIGSSSSNITFNTTQPIGLFVAKFDTSGKVIDAKKIESTNSITKLYTLDVDTSGYYLSGYFNGDLITDIGTKTSKSNAADIFVYKVDNNLNGKWIITAGGSSNDVLTSCSVGNNGYFYFGGYFSSPSMTVDSTASGILSKKIFYNKTSDGKTDIYFAKYKYDGTLQWFNTAGSIGNDYLYRALYKNGNFIAAGQYGGSLTFNNKTIVPKDNADAFAIVQNQNDNLVYLLPFGGVGTDVGETAVVDNNGNFVVIGDYTSPKLYIGNNNDSLTNSNAGTKDMFVVKYDKGSLTKVITPISCSSSATGAINLTPEGTVVAPYTYSWTKDGDATFSANTEDISGLSAGKYRVTFTDALGYTKKDSVTLTNPVPINVAFDSVKNVTCYNSANGKIYITPTGGSGSYSYLWTSINGSGIDAIAQDQTTLTAGTYYVTVADTKGCTASLSSGVTLTQPQRISFNGTIITRKNGHPGAVNLSVQGGTPAYSYSWTGPLSFTATTEDISELASAGDYTVILTDANACTNDTTVLVQDAYVFMAYTGTITDVKCHGGSDGSASIIVENAVGDLTYTWSNGANTATVSNLSAGDYIVTVTDAQPVSVLVNVHIAQPAESLSVSISRTNITCHDVNNGIADANPTGGTMPYTYSWKKDGYSYDGGSEVQNGLSAGIYTVTVTDAHGCYASGSNTVVNPDIITFTGTVTGVTCEQNSKNDGAITLSNILGGTGAYSYQWSNGFTTQNVTLLPTGNFSVTITDANNCSANASYVIGYDAPISLSMTVSGTKCYGSTDGAIDLNVSGGHPDLNYLWSTGAVTQNLKNLAPGSYSVTVTDSKNCKSISSASVVEPQALVISHTVYDATTNDPWNGKIEVVASGGTEPYLYTLSTGPFNGTGIFNCLSSGSFSVAVNDANNCGPVNTGTLYISYITAIPGASEVALKLFPNPASDYLYITYNKTVQKDWIIELISLNGKIIQTEKLDSNILSGTYKMDLQGIAKGIYLVKINGTLTTEKIIKQ
jgi:hypothetical protein